jgi:hypothetical protein
MHGALETKSNLFNSLGRYMAVKNASICKTIMLTCLSARPNIRLPGIVIHVYKRLVSAV